MTLIMVFAILKSSFGNCRFVSKYKVSEDFDFSKSNEVIAETVCSVGRSLALIAKGGQLRSLFSSLYFT